MPTARAQLVPIAHAQPGAKLLLTLRSMRQNPTEINEISVGKYEAAPAEASSNELGGTEENSENCTHELTEISAEDHGGLPGRLVSEFRLSVFHYNSL